MQFQKYNGDIGSLEGKVYDAVVCLDQVYAKLVAEL